MRWTHQIASCHQSCHGGFTAKITGSPNIVCAVNHATEDLLWRLLILQIWFVRSTMPRRIYSKDYWFSKYGLYGQPCHGGFTVKITDIPNMVCTVNHATEDLQWRLLILQIWFVRSIMHGGFTVKITDSSNMVCTVNHVTEDLQYRILDYSKYCSLHYHVQMEREERLRRRREQYRARREKETEEQRESKLARRRWLLNFRHLQLIHRHVFTLFTHARTIVFQLLDM